MQSIAMMIMKGVNIHMIHDVDRPAEEMWIGLMSWIPLHMTGKVTSFFPSDLYDPGRYFGTYAGKRNDM